MTTTGTTARERLFNQPRRTKPVTLSTGDVVEIRPLSLTERTKLVKGCTVDDEVDSEKLIPAIVIACTFDPASGEPLFTAGDRETIEGLPASEVDPLWSAAAALNGLGGDAVAKAEED